MTLYHVQWSYWGCGDHFIWKAREPPSRIYMHSYHCGYWFSSPTSESQNV